MVLFMKFPQMGDGQEANYCALSWEGKQENLEKNPSLVQLVGLEPVASHTTVECFN